ncbi:hypothetical protein TNCV_4870441, partial [Trichonephila clavipes]
GCFGETYCSTLTSSREHLTTQTDSGIGMSIPTARNVAQAGSGMRRRWEATIASSVGLVPIFKRVLVRKVAGYANAKGIGKEIVPFNRRSATAPLNRNGSIHDKRNQLPLKPACSLIIHK